MTNWTSSPATTRPHPQHLPLSWMDGPSVYNHILQHLDPASGRLTIPGRKLPDQKRWLARGRINFAPGALDAHRLHYPDVQEFFDLAPQVTGYLAEIAGSNSPRAKMELYQFLLPGRLLNFETAQADIIASQVPLNGQLHEYLVFLAKNSPDRGPVKLAIALLGLSGDPRDAAVISLLGRHEEFTLHAQYALTTLLVDPEPELLKLAQKVNGWARVQLVTHLASTHSPATQDWLLRQGYQHSCDDNYLAYHCATGGDLRAALAAPEVDDELLYAAGRIITAMLHADAGQNIRDYAAAAEVILRYLELIQARPGEVDFYISTYQIYQYLDTEWQPENEYTGGWNRARRAQALQSAGEILQFPGWPAILWQALTTPGQQNFFRVACAAEWAGMDVWEVYWNRLLEKPFEALRWSYALYRPSPPQLERVIRLALQVLPLDQLASGPADHWQNDGGAGVLVHFCLQMILTGLEPFPGQGWPLLALSLQSRDNADRHAVLQTLSAWGRENWPPEAQPALLAAFAAESNSEIKKELETLLRTGTLEEPD